MSFRFLLLATAAGFAFASPAFALDRDSDFDMLEIAQAAPPVAAAGRTFSPKSMCQDMLARRIGNRAYIKARLELKPEQMTAWNAFEKASDEANTKSNVRCAALPAEMKDRPNYVDRLSIEEDAMKARVASIEAVKPTLVALYAVLTPEQKAILDKPRGMAAGREMRRHGGPR